MVDGASGSVTVTRPGQYAYMPIPGAAPGSVVSFRVTRGLQEGSAQIVLFDAAGKSEYVAYSLSLGEVATIRLPLTFAPVRMMVIPSLSVPLPNTIEIEANTAAS